MSRNKILAIDDELGVLELLELVLGEGGFAVVTARTGEEGLARARTKRPDLILLDLRMAEMDGWETLRRLKLDERTRQVPVVILSAQAEPKDKIRALQEGAVDYLIKPLSVREGVDRIRAVLRSGQDRT